MPNPYGYISPVIDNGHIFPVIPSENVLICTRMPNGYSHEDHTHHVETDFPIRERHA
jgi:hypothetical protein